MRNLKLAMLLTEEEYALLLAAAGGAHQLDEWAKMQLLLAAREVKSEGE